MPRLLGMLLAGLVALVIVIFLFSFVLGIIMKAAFWIGVIALVVFVAMSLTKQRRR